MNSIHSSKPVVVLAALLLVAALAVPVMAVTVDDEEVSDEAAVNERMTATFVLADLYQDPDFERWDLVARTELENATWTFSLRDQTGSQVEQVQIDEDEIEGDRVVVEDISADRNVAEIEVRVTGNVPAIGAGNYTYPEKNEFQVARMDIFVGGGDSGDIGEWSAVRYTDQSKEARAQLDAAREAIQEAEAADVDVSDARTDYQNAQQAFQSGDFELAMNLATQAEQKANTAREEAESQGQLMQYALIAVAVLALLAIIGGGFYVYRQRQQQATRIR